jgi:hypothetical protein
VTPARTVAIKSTEDGADHTIYLYTAPVKKAKAAGGK